MTNRLNKLLAATSKELTACYRDPDVFIYSIVLPALIYPLLLFFASEFLLWRTGAVDKMKVRIAFEQPESKLVKECRQRLGASEFAIQVSTAKPMEELQSGEVDAVIGTKDQDQIDVYMRGTSPSAADAQNKLRGFFKEWQSARFRDSVSGRSKDFLKIFSVVTKDLEPDALVASAAHESGTQTPIGSIKMVICAMLCLVCSCVAYGAMAPVVCLFTEEREKNTLPTTLLLPVSRTLIITSKLLTGAVVALSSGFANLVNLALVGVVIMAQTKILPTLNVAFILSETFPPLNIFGLMTLLICFSFTVAAVFSAAAACARDYSQAYNLLTIPLLWASVLPLIGALPVVHHVEFTTWLPIANLAYQIIDVLNKDVTPIHLLIAIAENFLLSVFCIVFIRNLLTSERLLSSPAN